MPVGMKEGIPETIRIAWIFPFSMENFSPVGFFCEDKYPNFAVISMTYRKREGRKKT
jgi:hypothetical protein